MATRRLLPVDKRPPRMLIVLLHGVGGDADTMMPLAQFLNDILADTVIVVPEAPIPFDLGDTGFQWFSVQGVTRANRGDRIRNALPVVQKMIDREAARYHLPWGRVGVCGFSQGAMISLALADGPNPPWAIASIAGRIATSPKVQIGQPPTIFLSHGSADQTVPFACLAEAKAAFRRAGYPVSALPIPTQGHEIGREQAAEIAHFFTAAFATKAVEAAL
jgi:phospholipase/carboxylesterase